MKRSRTFTSVFALLLIVVAVPAFLRFWSIRTLFLDSELRGAVTKELQAIADEHGWLLSDLSVTSVSLDAMEVHVRKYRRGHDPQWCLTVTFNPHTIHPCDSN